MFFILVLGYIDVPGVMRNVDFVNLFAFDYQTPSRNPKEADYPSPLFSTVNETYFSANALVNKWLVLREFLNKKKIVYIIFCWHILVGS